MKKLSIDYTELLELLNECKNSTLKDNYYRFVAYDTTKQKFAVYNRVFVEICEDLIPLYIFEASKHETTLNKDFNCATIIFKELLTHGFKAFCIDNDVSLNFYYNGTRFAYQSKILKESLKIGDKISIFCTGALIEAEITAINKDSIKTKHQPISWGNQIFKETSSLKVDSINKQPVKMQPHCFKNQVPIYA